MIAVFLCFFSGCTDLYDLDIVLHDTGSCMSRSLNTIVEYSSEIYYVFILYSSDNRLRVQTVKGVFPANFTQKERRRRTRSTRESFVAWSWRHNRCDRLDWGKNFELVERILLRAYYYGIVLYYV
jgi:hypothetical protein